MRSWLALAVFAIFILTLAIVSLPLLLIEFISTGGPAELPSQTPATGNNNLDLNIQIVAAVALLVLFLYLLLKS